MAEQRPVIFARAVSSTGSDDDGGAEMGAWSAVHVLMRRLFARTSRLQTRIDAAERASRVGPQGERGRRGPAGARGDPGSIVALGTAHEVGLSAATMGNVRLRELVIDGEPVRVLTWD